MVLTLACFMHDVLKCSSQIRRTLFCAHNVNNRLLGILYPKYMYMCNYVAHSFFSYTLTQKSIHVQTQKV